MSSTFILLSISSLRITPPSHNFPCFALPDCVTFAILDTFLVTLATTSTLPGYFISYLKQNINPFEQTCVFVFSTFCPGHGRFCVAMDTVVLWLHLIKVIHFHHLLASRAFPALSWVLLITKAWRLSSYSNTWINPVKCKINLLKAAGCNFYKIDLPVFVITLTMSRRIICLNVKLLLFLP